MSFKQSDKVVCISDSLIDGEPTEAVRAVVYVVAADQEDDRVSIVGLFGMPPARRFRLLSEHRGIERLIRDLNIEHELKKSSDDDTHEVEV